MQTDSLKVYKGGWLVGQFSPSLFQRDNIEVGIHHVSAGTITDSHFHCLSTEFNIVIKGAVLDLDSGQLMTQDDIFIYGPCQKSNLQFIEDTSLLVIRDASHPSDKHYE